MSDITVEEIFEKLKENIIKEQRTLEEVKIDDNLNILFDSLEIVELIMYAEDEFNVSIPEYEVMNLETFKNLCNEILMQIIRKNMSV